MPNASEHDARWLRSCLPDAGPAEVEAFVERVAIILEPWRAPSLEQEHQARVDALAELRERRGRR